MYYNNLSEITVKSQKELDMIPDDFNGKIYVEFGDWFNPAILRKKYYNVVACKNSRVEAWGNSSVKACENSRVEAHNNSSVVAHDNSSVLAYGNSSVVACENSSVLACENSSVLACENSRVEACENSRVEAHNNSSVVAHDNSSVLAHNNSSVEAYGNSSVEARGNSSVEAYGNSQIVDMLQGARIELSGNSRIVYMPKSIEEYCSFYGISHNKKKGIFYKCVHKIDNHYFSDYDNEFEYFIEKKIEADAIDNDISCDYGHGINMAYLQWVLDYGRTWNDLAIIEVEANLDDIVVPKAGRGIVRCKEVKVIKEVPLEECGVYGKILSKRKE